MSFTCFPHLGAVNGLLRARISHHQTTRTSRAFRFILLCADPTIDYCLPTPRAASDRLHERSCRSVTDTDARIVPCLYFHTLRPAPGNHSPRYVHRLMHAGSVHTCRLKL